MRALATALSESFLSVGQGKKKREFLSWTVLLFAAYTIKTKRFAV